MLLAVKRGETISYYNLKEVTRAEQVRDSITLYFKDYSPVQVPLTKELDNYIADQIKVVVDADNPPNNLIQMPEVIKR